MGMVEVVETLEAKLKRHEDALVACMAEIEKLRAENALLRSAEGAHDVLRRLYLDETQSSGNRIKAAQAALNVEKPRLAPQPAPLNLVAEEIEDLATLVHRRRKRQDSLCPASAEPPIEVLPDGRGNGSDRDGD